MLWGAASGRCSFPNCPKRLVSEATTDDPRVMLGEMAHIVGESVDGPRGESPLMHALDEFPHGHVPSPLRLADHRSGDTPVDELLREIMILTKLNWNSSDFCSRDPITLASAREVAEVLREVPASQEPLAQYKYYV